MQIIIQNDEAWSLMTVITSHMIDNAGLSAEGKAAVRQWRTAHDRDSAGTADLTEAMNAALGGYIADRTNRTVRKKGRYVRKGETR
jgi:hypothetical protein